MLNFDLVLPTKADPSKKKKKKSLQRKEQDLQKHKLLSRKDFSLVYSVNHTLLEPHPTGLVFVKFPTDF